MTARGRPHALRWLPPFVVGLSAATAAEVSAGLLLYMGPGLMRSLTLVLATAAAALAAGLRQTSVPGHDAVASIRRRWLLCMVAFLMATVFSASWSLLQDIGGGGVSQGLGLGIMAALPLYACGSVLEAMASAAATDPSGLRGGVGAAAALGAAVGFVATGVALPQVLTPASLFLVCLVLLSGGGLVYGSVLDGRLRIDVLARRATAFGSVRVEDRHLPMGDRGARLLFEGSSLRRWTPADAGATQPWDVAVFEALQRAWVGVPRVLLLGGGASSLSRLAVRAHPEVRVDVFERNGAVAELAAEHLHAGLPSQEGERVRVSVGNLDDLVGACTDRYELVVVDTGALGAAGGVGALSRAGWGVLGRALVPGGVLAMGPAADAEPPPLPVGWSLVAMDRDSGDALKGLGDASWDAESEGSERVVFASPGLGASVLPLPVGFTRSDGVGPVEGDTPTATGPEAWVAAAGPP